MVQNIAYPPPDMLRADSLRIHLTNRTKLQVVVSGQGRPGQSHNFMNSRGNRDYAKKTKRLRLIYGNAEGNRKLRKRMRKWIIDLYEWMMWDPNSGTYVPFVSKNPNKDTLKTLHQKVGDELNKEPEINASFSMDAFEQMVRDDANANNNNNTVSSPCTALVVYNGKNSSGYRNDDDNDRTEQFERVLFHGTFVYIPKLLTEFFHDKNDGDDGNDGDRDGGGVGDVGEGEGGGDWDGNGDGDGDDDNNDDDDDDDDDAQGNWDDDTSQGDTDDDANQGDWDPAGSDNDLVGENTLPRVEGRVSTQAPNQIHANPPSTVSPNAFHDAGIAVLVVLVSVYSIIALVILADVSRTTLPSNGSTFYTTTTTTTTTTKYDTINTQDIGQDIFDANKHHERNTTFRMISMDPDSACDVLPLDVSVFAQPHTRSDVVSTFLLSDLTASYAFLQRNLSVVTSQQLIRSLGVNGGKARSNVMAVNGGKTRTNSTADDPNHSSSRWVLLSTNSDGRGGPGMFPPITDNLTSHSQMGTTAIVDDTTSNLQALSLNYIEGNASILSSAPRTNYQTSIAGTIDEYPILDYCPIRDNRDYPAFDPASVDDALHDPAPDKFPALSSTSRTYYQTSMVEPIDEHPFLDYRGYPIPDYLVVAIMAAVVVMCVAFKRDRADRLALKKELVDRLDTFETRIEVSTVRLDMVETRTEDSAVRLDTVETRTEDSAVRLEKNTRRLQSLLRKFRQERHSKYSFYIAISKTLVRLSNENGNNLILPSTAAAAAIEEEAVGVEQQQQQQNQSSVNNAHPITIATTTATTTAATMAATTTATAGGEQQQQFLQQNQASVGNPKKRKRGIWERVTNWHKTLTHTIEETKKKTKTSHIRNEHGEMV